MAKSTLPDIIRNAKPTSYGPCAIHRIGGHYYVYKYASTWDKALGKSVTQTGPCIGKITDTGVFVPNERAPLQSPPPDKVRVYGGFGAYEMLCQIAPDVPERLKKFFPDDFPVINALAVLRIVDRVAPKLYQEYYENSWLGAICPGASMGEETLHEFLWRIGRMQTPCANYLRSFVRSDSKLLVDGTCLFSVYGDSLSETGHNPQHKTRRQVRILYIFDRTTRTPAFYVVLQGSCVDGAALVDALRVAGVTDCLVIGDKSFFTEKNAEWMREAGIRHILPLRSNTSKVDKEYYAGHILDKCEEVFLYQGRPIYCARAQDPATSDWVYTYFDLDRMRDETAAELKRQAKKAGRSKKSAWDGAFDKSRISMRSGYFSYLSNLDAAPSSVFLDYRERCAVEEFFDYVKNVVEVGAAYARNDDSMRGWIFINHVSMLYFYALVEAMRLSELDEEYSHREVLDLSKLVHLNVLVDADGRETWFLQKPQARVLEIMDRLGVDLTVDPEAGPLSLRSHGPGTT